MSIDSGEYGLLMMQNERLPDAALAALMSSGADLGFLHARGEPLSLELLFEAREELVFPGDRGRGRGGAGGGSEPLVAASTEGDPDGDDDGDGIPNKDDPDSDIVVNGTRPRTVIGNPGDDTGGGGGDSTGGQLGKDPAYDLNHTEDCGTKDGAAEQVAKKIQTSDDPDINGNVPEFNWRNSEFGAVLVKQADGRIGVHGDTIHTDGNPLMASMPYPNDVGTIAGLVHNHPGNLTDYTAALIASYPSTGDWTNLAYIFESRNLPVPPDVSIYIVDAFGNVREFKYSDKDKYESMTDKDRSDPRNLPEAIKGVACGGA